LKEKGLAVEEDVCDRPSDAGPKTQANLTVDPNPELAVLEPDSVQDRTNEATGMYQETGGGGRAKVEIYGEEDDDLYGEEDDDGLD
jgi:hypothetical protein